ncbi:hypothetical protein DNTS_031087 [Danionella cerebrum]|uniref:Uncharacterized protein n=1 Tax=Danionella cerebrum TaxID=2873325 RepID=A0A553PXG8_9TELE|nr:hypothetical protein DNTS_031087 [Danionella translucida]
MLIFLCSSGFADYGFYSGPGDQRAAPCSFADYATLGPHTGQLLQSDHITSSCNSPSQHHPSPDHFKSSGANHSRPGGYPGANSPGPVADLYGPNSQDSAVGNYISAASPQPGSGFNHSLAITKGGSLAEKANMNCPPDLRCETGFDLLLWIRQICLAHNQQMTDR